MTAWKLLALLALLGLAHARNLQADGDTALTADDLKKLVGMWTITDGTGVDLTAAGDALKAAVKEDGSVDAAALNKEVFVPYPPRDNKQWVLAITGADPTTGLWFGYNFVEGADGRKSATGSVGAAERGTDGSLNLQYITDDSTATSFRTLSPDGKTLRIAYLQSVEPTNEESESGTDALDVRVSTYKRIEDAEEEKRILKEIAALL